MWGQHLHAHRQVSESLMHMELDALPMIARPLKLEAARSVGGFLASPII